MLLTYFFLLLEISLFVNFFLYSLFETNETKLTSLQSSSDLKDFESETLLETNLENDESRLKESGSRKVRKLQKRGFKLSSKEQLLENLENRASALDSTISSKTPYSFGEPLKTPIKKIFQEKEILNLSDYFLVSLLVSAKTGFQLVEDSRCSWLVLNPVVFDLETTECQLLIGFYFASTHTFVQVIVDIRDSLEIQHKVQVMLNLFFIEFSNLSKQFENDWQGYLNQSSKNLTLTFLTGFNINNFDIPVILKFLETDTGETNPVEETRKVAKNLLMLKDTKDFSSYSETMQLVLFVDIFWWTLGRLGTWVDILNDSKQFKPLQKKRWKKAPHLRWEKLQVQEWCAYNRGDLVASHVLGIFHQNYFNMILLRLAYSKTVGSQVSLSSIFRDRFII